MYNAVLMIMMIIHIQCRFLDFRIYGFFFGFLSLSREPKEIVQEICWCQNDRIYESFSNDFCISVFLYLWSSGFFYKNLDHILGMKGANGAPLVAKQPDV